MKMTFPRKDLDIAITELIYDLKGDWSVSALASKIGVPRNRLAWIFDAYKVKKEEKEPQLSQIEGTAIRNELEERRARGLYRRFNWELAPLQWIANSLEIRVSDLIRAAEDVQDGLPPWFEYRISKYTSENRGNSKDNELMCVFFEAFEYRTYVSFDILNDPGKDINRRKSTWYPSTSSYYDYEIEELKIFIRSMIDHGDLQDFVRIYRQGGFPKEQAYHLVKDAVDALTDKIRKKTDDLPDSTRLPTTYYLVQKTELAVEILKRFRKTSAYAFWGKN